MCFARIGHSAGADSPQANEDALIQAAKVDPDAFALLYQRYMPTIFRYLRARLGTDEDASDLTQQVFLKAIKALPKYQVPGPPIAAWLFRIAHNMTIDTARRQRASIPWHQVSEDLLPVDPTDPEGLVLHGELVSDIHDLLNNLSDEQRSLLALRFAAELSTAEIAAIMGKSDVAVRKQLSRILLTLRDQYHAR